MAETLEKEPSEEEVSAAVAVTSAAVGAKEHTFEKENQKPRY